MKTKVCIKSIVKLLQMHKLIKRRQKWR